MQPTGRLLLHNEVLEDREVLITSGSLVIGRDPHADLHLNESSVSRFHARIELQGADWVIVDLGSSNGTRVDGEPLSAARTLEDGSNLLLGKVQATFRIDAPTVVPAPPSEAEDTPVRRAPSAALALIGTVLVGATILVLTWPSDPPAPAHPEPHTAEAQTTPTEPADAPKGPQEDGSAAGASDETSPTPGGGAETVAPQPEDSPAPRWPDRVVLTDGTVLRGRIEAANSDAWLAIVTERGAPPRRIGRERVASINGENVTPDLAAIFAARRREAVGTRGLLALATWCAAHGLEAERRALAEEVTKVDPLNREAARILGRVRYLGAWEDATELKSRGITDPDDGTLLGQAQDVTALRSLWLDTLGRPPLPEELEEALGEPLDSVVDRLLGGPEPWIVWLDETLARFLGGRSAELVGDLLEELPDELATGQIDFREAFRALALSDAVRVALGDDATYARSILSVLLGSGALEDAALVRAATLMVGGQRTAVLGDRGDSVEELLEILLRQPNFYRIQYRREAVRALGAEPDLRDLRRGAIRLAGAPDKLMAMRREWLLDSERREAARPPRPLTTPMTIHAVWVATLGRPPVRAEERRARILAAGLGSAELVPTTLGRLLLASERCRIETPEEAERASWIRRTWRDLIGRLPSEAEQLHARALLDAGDPEAVILSLIGTKEFRTR